jgi:phosphoribosylformylglycinamidine cyclo-ligase
MSLTYRSSGVDIEAAGRAKGRIQALVRRTHGDSVVSRPGLFGGAVRLEDGQDPSHLTGALGLAPDTTPEPPACLVERCLAGLPPGSLPVAFLDYVASAGLEPGSVERLVEGFADRLAGLHIPLIGGETAEMPGVLRPGTREVVGALFGIRPLSGEGEGGGRPSSPGAAGRPCLVFSMDGVGTKTKLGVLARSTSGLALDIIHHSLNDILCLGAAGLGLLFYVGCHRREEELLAGFRDAATQACARLGLSVLAMQSEKPGTYLPGEIDVCAAVAGVVGEKRLVQGAEVRAGDVLVGLASDGLHTNGYSLARRALLERAGLKLDGRVAELGVTLAEALLRPHRNYAPAVLPLLGGEPSAVHAVAHITGGGLADNLARVLPEGLRAVVRLSSWEVPPLFRLIQLRRCPSRTRGKGMYETSTWASAWCWPWSRKGKRFRSLSAGGERPCRWASGPGRADARCCWAMSLLRWEVRPAAGGRRRGRAAARQDPRPPGIPARGAGAAAPHRAG